MYRNRLESITVRCVALLVVLVLMIQMPLSVDAKMVSSMTASSFETSSSAPQRLSASVTGNYIRVNMYDESASDSIKVLVAIRHHLETTIKDLTRDEKYFYNHNCNLTVDMSSLGDGYYDMIVWEYRDGSYQYYNRWSLIRSNNSSQFYSVNGKGQEDFLNNLNANYDPNNYIGFSYWAQKTDRYDEIARLTREITANCSTDEEKVRVIHDWICTNIAYDYEAYYSDGVHPERSDASWVFDNRRGVCSGYARVANCMLTAVGIPKMNITGRAYNLEEGVDYDQNHEWNAVYYNGSWHIFDFTHDSLNRYYGSGDSRNVIGHAPVYFNYDMTTFASGLKHLTTDTNDTWNYDGYGTKTYRVYNRSSSEHFYSMDANEVNYLISLGWRYEGESWKSPMRSNTPVYRLYNTVSGEHHYTTSVNERDQLCRGDWRYEGIAWYSDDKSRVPVYRLYNPNTTGVGSHHYTYNFYEVVALIYAGWNYEGIGWYGV